MKKYTEIIKEIAANNDKIKELEARADKLLKTAERAAANSISEKIAIGKSVTPEEDAAAVEAYAEIENLKAINTILSENARASFTAYVEPIIRNIMQPYTGKQYGEKTREKIRAAAKENNIAFYFDGYGESYRVNVYCLSNEGYKAYNMPEITINAVDAAGHTTAFITESNKIADFNNITFSSHYKYTENPGNKKAELEAAYNEFKKLVEAAAAAESKLNAMLPDKTERFNIIGHLSPWKKPY